MNPVTDLGAEDVVDEAVLGDPAQPAEGGCGDDRVEVVPIAGNLRAGTRDAGLDPVLQLLGGSRHALKRSEMLSLY